MKSLSLRFTALALTLTLAGGCASIPLEERDARDPLESFNRAMYTFNDGLDTMLLKPAATVYEAVMPGPADRAVSNFFSNLDDLLVMVHNLLQGKPTRAAEDLTRVVFNSTFGVLGLVDVATPLGLPKHKEDFGQTLAVWGVGSGPYLVLPFFGPSTIRDAAGLAVDRNIHPLTQVEPDQDRYQLYALDAIDRRADLLRAEKVARETAFTEPYVFDRDAYLQRRERLVYDGNPPPPDWQDEVFD